MKTSTAVGSSNRGLAGLNYGFYVEEFISVAISTDIPIFGYVTSFFF